jgi:Ribonuclease G/E
MTDKPDRIFVTRGPGETRAALISGERLLEAVFLRDVEAQTGAAYVGVVGERVPGSSDVFVDIGITPHGLLETKGQKFTAGQLIAVEVATPARADKGHKLKLSARPVPNTAQKYELLQPAPHPVLGWWRTHQSSISDIVVDGIAQRKAITQLLGSSAPIVGEVEDEMTFADIDEQIDEALQTTLHLRSGGRVTIEQTSALVAVDIDAGSASIDQTNHEAMAVIAHQIRLRNLAGHIVVDLIHTKGKQRFVNTLKDLCADDPAETRVMGLTPSGMIDIVRQRIRPSLAEILLNAETTGYRALRMACKELMARRVARIQLKVSPAVAALLNEKLQPALAEARDLAKGEILIEPQTDYPVNRIEVSA